MKKLSCGVSGLVGAWSASMLVGVVACGAGFASDNCEANRTCAPSEESSAGGDGSEAGGGAAAGGAAQD